MSIFPKESPNKNTQKNKIPQKSQQKQTQSQKLQQEAHKILLQTYTMLSQRLGLTLTNKAADLTNLTSEIYNIVNTNVPNKSNSELFLSHKSVFDGRGANGRYRDMAVFGKGVKDRLKCQSLSLDSLKKCGKDGSFGANKEVYYSVIQQEKIGKKTKNNNLTKNKEILKGSTKKYSESCNKRMEIGYDIGGKAHIMKKCKQKMK